jgi:hypothetical protein
MWGVVFYVMLAHYKYTTVALTVKFYKNQWKTQIVIVAVSKLAVNLTKNNPKQIMKSVIPSLKNNNLFRLWAQFVCNRQLISGKTNEIKKNQTTIIQFTASI